MLIRDVELTALKMRPFATFKCKSSGFFCSEINNSVASYEV